MTLFSNPRGSAVKVSGFIKIVKMFLKAPKVLVLNLYKGMNDNLALDTALSLHTSQGWNPSTKLVWVFWSTSQFPNTPFSGPFRWLCQHAQCGKWTRSLPPECHWKEAVLQPCLQHVCTSGWGGHVTQPKVKSHEYVILCLWGQR